VTDPAFAAEVLQGYLTMHFLAIFTFAVSLSASLLIVVPLVGVIVRYRANYNPKGLQLDSEGVVQPPHTGPIVSFFGMFKRVYMLEVGYPV
jgi:hypothetical protein